MCANGECEESQQNNVQPVFCVRRGAEDWIERKLELDQDTSLVAWIPAWAIGAGVSPRRSAHPAREKMW